jgi:hypothetical protein
MVSLVTLLGSSCRTEPWSYEERIGVVASKGGKTCLEIRNSAVPQNAELQLVSTAPLQIVAKASVGARDTGCGDGGELRGYSVPQPMTGAMPVIGLINYRGAMRREGDLISADLDGDGASEYFRSCASQEGIHFTVWTGKPLTGKLRWHRYYYLGYDIEPDCKPEEIGR